MQLFGVEEAGILDNLPAPEDDTASAMACFAGEPYVVLGCDSGDLRLVALLDAEGGLAHAPARITQMESHIYQGAPA